MITPDGATAYVLRGGGVLPISVATNQAHKLIRVRNSDAQALIMAPGGQLIYAVGNSGGPVTAIRTATGTARSIRMPDAPVAGAAFTPDGTFAYVATRSGELIPISTATGTVGKPIHLATADVSSFAIAP